MSVFPDVATMQFGDSWMGILHTLVLFEDGVIMGVTANKPQMQVVVKGCMEFRVIVFLESTMPKYNR